MPDIILFEFNTFGFRLWCLDIVAYTAYIRYLSARVNEFLIFAWKCICIGKSSEKPEMVSN